MSLTKTTVTIWDGQNLPAGNAQTTSASINTEAYHTAQVFMRLTNGATGPSTNTYMGVQIGAESGGSPRPPIGDFVCRLYCGTAANQTESLVVDVPMGAVYLQVYADGNDGQAVTADAWLVGLTESIS